MLNLPTVLVLNRHWQAIHVKTPTEAFCMIATGAATALDVQADDPITPVRWDDWLKLPVREHDNAANYAKVPLCRPRFGARGIWERGGGVCQYTGRKRSPEGAASTTSFHAPAAARRLGTTASSPTAK
jgi:hypothetical protein